MSQPRRWTPVDDKVLREMRAKNATYREIAPKVGRSEKACRMRAAHLGVRKASEQHWPRDDVKWLKRERGRGLSFEKIAFRMNRSVWSVRKKCIELGLNTASTYAMNFQSDTGVHARIVEMRLAGATLQQISDTIGHSPSYVGRICKKNGLIDGGRSRLSERNVEIIRLRQSGMIFREIGKRFGISVSTVSDVIRDHEKKIAAGQTQTAALNDVQVRHVRAMTKNGMTAALIASRLGVGEKQVLDARRKHGISSPKPPNVEDRSTLNGPTPTWMRSGNVTEMDVRSARRFRESGWKVSDIARQLRLEADVVCSVLNITPSDGAMRA